MSNRLVRRFFRCNKCKEIEAQLVHPNKFDIKCNQCGTYLNEIQEKEFKTLKKARNQKNNEHKSNNDEPYRPSENVFRNISSVYNRPPSNLNNRQNNNNNNNNRIRFTNSNNNNTNQSQNQQRNRRYQSTNHYTDMNIVNDNNRYNNYTNNINTSNSNTFQNNNNINNSNHNNVFRSSNIGNSQNQNRININEQNENTGERRQYGQGARNRERSQDPASSAFLNNFFNNMFGFITPIIITSSNGQPFRIIVQRQNVPQNVFDPLFLSFGAMFDNNFRDNYSSNFRSNFRGDFLSEIIRILERNQEEAARRRHPPTSEAALKKLKRFPLTDKYCKKDKKGNIELPNCCICISDIEKNEETVLLPCGHMFHWNCCLNWLKSNNTCPMCRFEIKE